MQMPQETIALLGTGIMGSAMGRRLTGAGFEVRAWNRTRARAEPLAEAGATIAGSPAEAAEGATVLLTMLSDGPAVEAAATPALPALAPDAVWLQMSTIAIDDTTRLGGLAASAGVAFVDAPVLGTRQPAEEGKLTVFASGPEALAGRCAPVFEPLAAGTIWLGPAGAGTRHKLVVNTWLHALMGSLAETIAFARGIGVDPERFLRIIDGAPIGAPYAQLKGKMMIGGEYPASFSADMGAKDVRVVLEAAKAAGLELPILSAAGAAYEEAARLGHGGDDIASIYEATRPDRA
jgi:3-hydroxyisobutyrate dehydrogenase